MQLRQRIEELNGLVFIDWDFDFSPNLKPDLGTYLDNVNVATQIAMGMQIPIVNIPGGSPEQLGLLGIHEPKYSKILELWQSYDGYKNFGPQGIYFPSKIIEHLSDKIHIPNKELVLGYGGIRGADCVMNFAQLTCIMINGEKTYAIPEILGCEPAKKGYIILELVRD
jgi:hypothetical protein